MTIEAERKALYQESRYGDVPAIPALIARFVTDITLGYGVFYAVNPKKRADLF